MPTLAMLTAVFFWSSSIIGMKFALAAFVPAEAMAARAVLAALAMWTVALAMRQAASIATLGWRPLLMGLLEPGLVSAFIMSGLARSPATTCAVMWSLMPLLQPVLGRLVLKEAIRPSVVVGAALALAGTLILIEGKSGEGQVSLLGDAFLAIGVGLAAINQLIARRVAQRSGRPAAVTAWQLTGSIGIGLLFLAFFPPPVAPFTTGTPSATAGLVYVGLIAGVAPFLLYNYALQHIPVGRISLFGGLTAPMGAPMAFLILGEALTLRDVLAIAVVTFAVMLPSLADWWRQWRAPSPGQE